MTDIHQEAATRWLRPDAAADYLCLSPRTLGVYRQKGGGPDYHRISKNIVVYDRMALDGWMETRRASNTTQERLSGQVA